MRITTLATAAVAAVALAVPTAGVISSPAGAVEARTTTSTSAVGQPIAGAEAFKPKKGKKGKLQVKKAEKGVQPGIANQKITVKVKGSGKVKFALKGVGINVKKKVKIKKGKAVYAVPPLGTGSYKVVASYQGKKGSTKFEVYNSNLTVNSTTFTFSKSASPSTWATLSGSVVFKNAAASTGYVDVYLNGNLAGGSTSPDFFGFTSIRPGGTFDFGYQFGDTITTGNGKPGNAFATGLAPGTYTLQAFYTDDPAYANYISSNIITVVVTP